MYYVILHAVPNSKLFYIKIMKLLDIFVFKAKCQEFVIYLFVTLLQL